MKKIHSVLFLLLCVFTVYAQSDCAAALNKAKELYHNGDYNTALKVFKFAQLECGATTEIQEWINKCNVKIKGSASGTTTSRLTLSCSSSLLFTSDGGSISISVSGDGTFSASSSDSWLTISTSSGKIVASCQKNYSSYKKTATIDVYHNGNYEQSVSVTQSANTSSSQSSIPSLSLNLSSLTFEATGYTDKYVNVTSNVTSWTYECRENWIYPSRDGNQVKIWCANNNSSSSRTGYVYVKIGNTSKPILITQKAAVAQKLTLSRAKLYFEASQSGYQTITVSGAGTYRASTNESWIHIKQNSGDFQVSLSQNTGYSARTGTISIYHNNQYEQSVSVTQAAASIGYRYSYYNRWYNGKIYSNDKYESWRMIPTEIGMDWLSIGVGAGYPEYVQLRTDAFRFRFFMFEVAPASFIYGYTGDQWDIKYTPTIGMYFPLNTYGANDLSLVFRAGPSIDCRMRRCWFVTELALVHLWDCEFMANNFFIRYDGSINVGITFDLSIPGVIY